MKRITAAAAPIAALGAGLAALLLVMVAMPFLGLLFSTESADLLAALGHRRLMPALWLSATTTGLSLSVIVLTGTPLAWWLSRSRGRRVQLVEFLLDLPLVVPPAVVGIALLATFGQRGLLAVPLSGLGLRIPFSSAAVVIAQTVVSAPFFVQAAAHAFRSVDDDTLLVARTLGASSLGAFVRVALPTALPSLLAGAALAWARAVSEFGATLVFAGNLSGTTQTMPLAIYALLEEDVRVATALSLCMAGWAALCLLSLRALPSARLRRRGKRAGER